MIDGLISAAVVRYFSHEVKDFDGDPLWEDAHADETVSAWDEWGANSFNMHTCCLVCSKVRNFFDETRPLFLAGAILSRKTAAW